ncbi:hypothetical protein [Aporhodopirellula aestuarii]|uniref:Uncharacterized protein n=1 Tax=Aporhodopirellula aestuarii TaxID=2950107 RepID=A0ABT0TYU5_9BACT|nr:hypothetical protein [Aporhodopirellula aestuarii]MCM2369656.1 hypothetical protein [Aporhodopirellula aestuarii]
MKWLKQNVEVHPSVTVAHVFDAVSESDDMVEFLTQFTGCDVRELHVRDRSPTGKLGVSPGYETVGEEIQVLDEIPANVLRIWREVSVYNDEESGELRFWSRLDSMVSNFDCLDCGTTLGRKASEFFGDICGLSIRVEAIASLSGWGGKSTGKAETHGVTLLEFLEVLYGMFGKPEYDLRDAKAIEIDAEVMERMRKMLGMDDDPADWWKTGGTGDGPTFQ